MNLLYLAIDMRTIHKAQETCKTPSVSPGMKRELTLRRQVFPIGTNEEFGSNVF
jgi:hypothetical protein